MRIILKPAGAIIILAAFGFLVFMLIHRGGSDSSANPPAPSGAPQKQAAAPAIASPAATDTPQNTGFESDYQAVQPYDNKATLTGVTAVPWRDDSSWAHVTVNYAQDSDKPHSGAASQRIEVKDVQRVGNNPNAVQFVQTLNMPQGKTYNAELWVRAATPTPVEFSLRQAGWPYTYYGAKTATIGKDWTSLRVSGTISKDGQTYILLKLWQPGTVWVDDASVTIKS